MSRDDLRDETMNDMLASTRRTMIRIQELHERSGAYEKELGTAVKALGAIMTAAQNYFQITTRRAN